MYPVLLVFHSVFRWLLLTTVVYSLFRALTGLWSNREFNAFDNRTRHWTATIAHLQLVIGILLYVKSPIPNYFWHQSHEPRRFGEHGFFAVIHASAMVVAVIVITIGSALAKRQEAARNKYKIILISYLLSFLIFLVAMPWPFSPFVSRPYFRPF